MLSYIEQNESWRVNRMSQTAVIRAWGKDREWLNRPGNTKLRRGKVE